MAKEEFILPIKKRKYHFQSDKIGQQKGKKIRKCHSCDKVFKGAATLKNHIQKIHSVEEHMVNQDFIISNGAETRKRLFFPYQLNNFLLNSSLLSLKQISCGEDMNSIFEFSGCKVELVEFKSMIQNKLIQDLPLLPNNEIKGNCFFQSILQCMKQDRSYSQLSEKINAQFLRLFIMANAREILNEQNDGWLEENYVEIVRDLYDESKKLRKSKKNENNMFEKWTLKFSQSSIYVTKILVKIMSTFLRRRIIIFSTREDSLEIEKTYDCNYRMKPEIKHLNSVYFLHLGTNHLSHA